MPSLRSVVPAAAPRVAAAMKPNSATALFTPPKMLGLPAGPYLAGSKRWKRSRKPRRRTGSARTSTARAVIRPRRLRSSRCLVVIRAQVKRGGCGGGGGVVGGGGRTRRS